MLYGLTCDRSKSTASPGKTAACPLCFGELVPKCGEIISWHWAHKNLHECDGWAEPESEWHLQWKMAFPQDWRERLIEKNGKKHIADVLTPKGIAIEFQRSSLAPTEIRAREEFYGRMLWIFDVIEARASGRLDFRYRGGWVSFRWKQPQKHIAYTHRPTYLDVGSGALVYLKKIYAEAPCGGWGYVVPKSALLERMGGDSALDF